MNLIKKIICFVLKTHDWDIKLASMLMDFSIPFQPSGEIIAACKFCEKRIHHTAVSPIDLALFVKTDRNHKNKLTCRQ